MLPPSKNASGQMTEGQTSILDKQREFCEMKIQETESPSNGSYCPMIWDGLFCWPYTPAGKLHSVPCPDYVQGFNGTAYASRQCAASGEWWVHAGFNKTWTNYSQCYSIPDHHHNEESRWLELHLGIIKLMSKAGYSVSLGTLLVALLILASIKKLRCPRNNLHLQLFLSFIMRAMVFLLKDRLFLFGVGFASNVEFSENSTAVFLHSESNVDCKVFMSLFQYFLTANYCWILVEGLYLHNLIFRSMFTDTSGIKRYVILGWGLPAVVVIPWIVLRATLHDKLCWTTHEDWSVWIISGPTLASVLINFFFFINISRVLFLKMFSTQAVQAKRERYRKWFKSTLILMPLFGVHYAILMTIHVPSDWTSEIIWLYTNQIFSSFQGFFVALLYCFLNGEVQSEVKKLIQTHRSHSYRSSHSFLTQSLTYLSRGRSSIQSLHSVTGTARKGKRESKRPTFMFYLQPTSDSKAPTDKRDGHQNASPKTFVSKRDDRETASVCLTTNTPLPSPRSSAGNSANFHHEDQKFPNSHAVELKYCKENNSTIWEEGGRARTENGYRNNPLSTNHIAEQKESRL